jgi:hypothetical protein
LRNHPSKTSLKPDARPSEAEAHSAISHWKHIDISVALFFPRFILYALTARAMSRGGSIVHGKTDLKRNMYLLSWRV